MKNPLFVLAIAASTFVIGCQENSIVDPVNNHDALSNAAIAQTPVTRTTGTLLLQGIARPENSATIQVEYLVDGQIDYSIAELPSLRSPMIEVRLSTGAVLSPITVKESPVKLTGNSAEVVSIGKGGVTQMEKRYRVLEGKKEITFSVHLFVSNKGLSLDKMYVEVSPSSSNPHAERD